MKWLTFCFIFFCLIFNLLLDSTFSATPDGCLSAQQLSLANAMNSYRIRNGLSPISVSASLSLVAQWHVIDLHENKPHTPVLCNPHSWSNAQPLIWSPVCYTDDHAYASEMWNKPSQITEGIYIGNGYEIASWTSGLMTPALAVALWDGSPPHKEVVLEQSIWADHPWAAMGIGINEHYAVVWFGEQTDPQNFSDICPSDSGFTEPSDSGFTEPSYSITPMLMLLLAE